TTAPPQERSTTSCLTSEHMGCLTGPAPNTLAALCDDAIAVEASSSATVQEIHLVIVHAMCIAIDDALGVVASKPQL
ncbi:MAG: phosphoheptose isomerase, partial [Actinomycetes bacterium]